VSTKKSETEIPRKKEQALGRTLIRDVRRGDFRRTVSRDLRELYTFYLDKDRRARLARMGRIRRWLTLTWWIAKSMFLKLTPARRILLVIAILLMIQGHTVFSNEEVQVETDIPLLSIFILLLILALELKDKLLAQDELAIGRAVQRALMPTRNPEVPGWSTWLFTRPANEVGGDLVDYLPVGGSRLGLSLGDVAGKGLGAALLMAKLQSTLRALAPGCVSLSDLGSQVNVIIHRDGIPNRFATLVYMEIEPDCGMVRFLNAGHPPPLALRATGVEELPAVALPLGIQADALYTEQCVDLSPGEILVVYSDGFTDALNSLGEYFGEERLKNRLAELRELPADELGKALLREVEHFVGEAKPSDDLSIIVLKRSAPPPGGREERSLSQGPAASL
jgi:hypothetical protein